MRIGGPTSGSKVQKRSSAKEPAKSGSTFTPASAEETEQASVSSGAGAVYGVDALLSLQEVEDPLTGKRKGATKRGHDLLYALEKMKADLLAGVIPEARLERILKPGPVALSFRRSAA
ncbi:flagellar assembly protein FliX [Breoghania sp.]|uniref:flagellar assembly protein FliX n=1 Tax=Breoghania sp. TaxID=2065378 RepID=UPI0026349816|nr:flagellar assembly protein FliX [Breoghania sp.]MDJ0932100.1 flagellar assembly protein FliX [Breoghania sp.]